ncbi:MAG: hypothetical protein M0R39_11620 [Prolixibacteraceae bacterium]|jgi:hypothetical protein|nr:hypothetical protein [Prolixibacteraceae bacterium]
MKRKPAELDVDFIGGQDPMTKEEEHAISEYIKAHKLLGAKKPTKVKKASQPRKINA